MVIVDVFLVVASIGVLVWLLVKFVPMPEPFPRLLIGLGAVVAFLYILESFGVLPHLR